jgi:hypothetical protein
LIYFAGAATVRLEMPIHMQSALIFHYNLKFYNKDTDNFEGVSLKRFVMQVILKYAGVRYNLRYSTV